jgi:hypothetical protein
MQLTYLASRTLHTGAVVLCALIITSCAAVRPVHDFLTGRQNLVPPKDPIFGPGMKLYSPDETGWYRVPNEPGVFALVKAGRNKGETFAFQTYALELGPGEDRDKLIAKYRTNNNNEESPRFKNIKVDVNAYPEGPGGNCLLKHWTVEDHAPAGLEGKGPMILESMDFVCLHPHEKSKAAFLSYSQRYFPGGRDALLAEKASACIRRLEFNDESKPRHSR